ncbi:MAG TPA: S8 family serine peptidase [Polyangiaceae bacterium]|nr:S8 family serine peptidase [Polyangiaceae bacterium]
MTTHWNVSWQHRELEIPELWTAGCFGKGATVALLDSGLAAPRGLDRRDFEYLDARGQPILPSDSSGHGTCCGSLIASYRGGALGIAPHAKLVSLRVLDTGTSLADVESALDYLVQQRPDVDVVSCSFVMSRLTPGVQASVRALTNRGQLVVAAAGNDQTPSPFPEGTLNALTVAAVDRQRSPLSGARLGSWIDLAAPGKDLPVIVPGTDAFALFSQSSAAAAVVSGVAALVLSAVPPGGQRRKFAAGLEGHFRSTAQALSGQDPKAIGQGLVNPRALLRLARA